MRKEEIISSILGAFGLTVSVQDVSQIINLILLIVSLINILWVLGYSVYNHIKNKEPEKITEDIEKAKNDIENLNRKEDEK